jgi:hypothetical protein
MFTPSIPVALSPRVSPPALDDSGTFTFSAQAHNPEAGPVYLSYEIWQDPVLQATNAINGSMAIQGAGTVNHGASAVPGIETKIIFRNIRAGSDTQSGKAIKNECGGRIKSSDKETTYKNRVFRPSTDAKPIISDADNGVINFYIPMAGGKQTDVTYKITYAGTQLGGGDGVVASEIIFDEIETTISLSGGTQTITYSRPPNDNTRLKTLSFQITKAISDGARVPFSPIPVTISIVPLDAMQLELANDAPAEPGDLDA